MNKQINPFAKKQIDAIENFCATKQPLVAIKCVTYNHEKYLKDALEGFVKQKTKFPFVAIVHDDASTDKTASILKEYADKYPDIILPIYETENQHSKFDGSLLRITTGALTATGAKYIAICEGDDYWTDPLKLQKQVDFLESHPDYSLVFHPVKFIDQELKIHSNYCALSERTYTIYDVLGPYCISTCSAVLKMEVFGVRPNHPNFQVGDRVMWCSASRVGKLYCINQTMGVYRRHEGGWSTQKLEIIYEKQLKHAKAMIDSFPEIYPRIFKKESSNYRLLWIRLRIKSHESWIRLALGGFKYPIVYTSLGSRFIITSIKNKCRQLCRR